MATQAADLQKWIDVITEFKAVPNGANPAFKTSPWPATPAIERMVWLIKQHFECGDHVLANLIGASQSRIYDWNHGRSRPSPLLLMRIIMLRVFEDSGLDLKKVQAIDWDEGVIKWHRF